MKQTFNVTQKHIVNGHRFSCYRDPVALCLAEAFGTEEIYVDETLIDVKGKTANFSCKTPENVVEFIHTYDNKETVEPFSFELDIK